MPSAGGPLEGSGLADGGGLSADPGDQEKCVAGRRWDHLALKDWRLGEAEVVAAALGGASPVVIMCLPRE